MKRKITNIRSIQLINLETLKHFDNICNEEKLSYSLAGGTLIGAIRHKGFIPWDDDIDVVMLRDDYEKLKKKYLGKEIDNGNYEFIGCGENKIGIPFIRLIDKRTTVEHKNTLTMQSLWIDILPEDKIPCNIEGNKYLNKLKLLRKIRLFICSKPFTGKTKLKKIIKTPIAYILRKLGGEKIISNIIDNKSKHFKDEQIDTIVELVAQARMSGIHSYSKFRNSINLEFEGREFKVMPDYESYLFQKYGDWMILPNKKSRKPHKITVFLDTEKYSEDFIERISTNEYNQLVCADINNLLVNRVDNILENNNIDSQSLINLLYKKIDKDKNIDFLV